MIDGTTALDMNSQQALRLESGRDLVERVMSDGTPRTLWEIQQAVEAEQGGHYFSESTIGARIRDLRKDQYGGHTIRRRSRHGQTYEYWMED